MNAKTAALLNEVLNLPDQERWAFVDQLLEKIDPVQPEEDEASFWAKVDQRVADVQDGKVKSVPAEEAFAQARRQLRRS
jgi:putative addiction module component (TIGR02574 family)